MYIASSQDVVHTCTLTLTFIGKYIDDLTRPDRLHVVKGGVKVII